MRQLVVRHEGMDCAAVVVGSADALRTLPAFVPATDSSSSSIAVYRRPNLLGDIHLCSGPTYYLYTVLRNVLVA